MNQRDLGEFHVAWERFEAWLAAHVPAQHASLQLPASHAQIAAIEVQYGFPLHPQLRALLERHDGGPDLSSPDGVGAFLPGRHYLNGADFIVAQHEGVIHQRDRFAEYFPDWREGFTEEPLDAHADQWVPSPTPTTAASCSSTTAPARPTATSTSAT